MSARNYVLGGTLAGLAAGISGLTVIDEGNEGPSGTDFAYCVPIADGSKLRARFYKRTKSSEWARGDSAMRRAYQFCSYGLVPMVAPKRVAVEYFRRYSGVLGKVLAADGYNRKGEQDYNPLSIDTWKDHGYVLLDAARLIDGLASLCKVQRGRELTGISISKHLLNFANREPIQYDRLISTLPLDRLMRLVLPDKKYVPIADALQVLNVGIRPEGDVPFKQGVHQVLFPRGERLIDAVDLYSRVDYDAFTPTLPDRSRFALAAKHYVGYNEMELTPSSFRARVLSELEALGLKGQVEVAEYHYHRSAVFISGATLHRDACVEFLENAGIFQVGSLANALPMELDRDLLDGLAAGMSLA